MTQFQDIAILLLRLATAVNFLSPVADRFGIWGPPGTANVMWGTWQHFVEYTAQVNSFAPAAFIPFLAVAATVLEIVLSLLLIVGYKTRIAALSAALLTLVFAAAMAYSFGIKAPIDYAVFVDCSSAFLLATVVRYRWSVDELTRKKKRRYY